MADYCLCGWRLSSDVPLPLLPPWTGSHRKVDIQLRINPLPLPPDHSAAANWHHISDRGNLLQIADVARYWISGGNMIQIDPAPDAPWEVILQYVFGTVFGVLCHQRHLLPLHASTVAIHGQAVAFAGPSGIGKSTLAASLSSLGFAVVSDDICVLTIRRNEPPLVLPFAPRLKLMRDIVPSLNIPPVCAAPMLAEPQKLDVISAVMRQTAPLPLAAIYHLTEGTQWQATRLQGVAAIGQINDNIYRLNAARRMGRQEDLFAAQTRIATRIPSYTLTRGSDFGELAHLIRDMPQLNVA